MKHPHHPIGIVSLFTAISLVGSISTYGADKTRPTLVITFPAANKSVTNATITVAGKTKDNVGVTSVSYRLNGGDWGPVATTNNWTNWTARVTLTPGANTVQAYAVDASGNRSLTNTVHFTYLVYAPLTVHVEGRGKVSPNYDGKWLVISNKYKMTASAASGFKFQGWSGSLTTNKPTLNFVMASNLSFTATFLDTTRPIVAILGPKANAKLDTADYTVYGKASDNFGVTNVLYQLNGTGWNPATTTNHWTNWSAGITLSFGTNLIQACAVDAAGNRSLTNSVKCSCSAVAPGSWAPDSISGLSAVIASQHSFTVTFGDQTFSESMVPGTNLDQNAVGGYTYVKKSANTALLMMLKTAPPLNKQTKSNLLALTFTSETQATCPTNLDGTAGPLTLNWSQATNLAPASIAGQTVSVGSDSIIFSNNGTFTGTLSGTAGSGTYTYNRYSPSGALIVATVSTPPVAAGTHLYLVVTFSSASSGNYYLEAYSVFNTLLKRDAGPFPAQ